MKRRFALVALLATVLPLGCCLGQAAPVKRAPVLMKISKLTTGTPYTPRYNPDVRGGSNESSSSQQWLEMETEFATAPDWMDEISFTYYVAVETRSQKDIEDLGGRLHVFMGRVTHLLVEKGDNHRSSMYLHPKVLKRYGKPLLWSVVAEIGGQPVAIDTSGDPQKAFKLAKKVPKTFKWWELVKSKPIELGMLSREKTPFALFRYDEFEMIEPTGR